MLVNPAKMLIVSQASKYPLIQQAVNEKSQNLAALSKIVAAVAKDPENAWALEQMVFTNIRAIKDEQTLLKKVDAFKKQWGYEPKPQELAEMRQNSPITKKALEMQAELQKAIREGKTWAASQPDLKPQNSSANQVYKIYQQNAPEPAAFFKIGANDEQAAGKMEKLMWDMAVLLGLESQFVATGETELRAQSDLKGGAKEVMLWQQGELIEDKEALESKRGSIQVAQKGTLLSTADKSLLSSEEIVNGILTSAVFGMYDAHNKNIWVTEEGKIKFFDNTRSFPNSNGVILRGLTKYVSAYRCSLLDLPQSKVALTAVEVQNLATQVTSLKQKAQKVWEYLNSPHTQAVLDHLPPGWIDKKAAFNALMERLNLLDKALKNGAVKTGQDIALQSMPDYNFIAALTYLFLRENNITIDDLHACVGGISFNDVVNNLQADGIDIRSVVNWSCDPTLSFADVIKKIDETDWKAKTTLPMDEELSAFYEHLGQELAAKSAVDFKDWTRNSCETELPQHKKNLLRREGVPYLSNLAFALDFLDQDIKAAVIPHNEVDQVLYLTPTGYRMKKLNLNPVTRIVEEGGKEIPLGLYVKSLPTEPPKFEELLVLKPKACKELLKNSPNKLLLSKYGGGVLLTIKEKGAIRQIYCKGVGKGRFVKGGKPLSLAEIAMDTHKDAHRGARFNKP